MLGFLLSLAEHERTRARALAKAGRRRGRPTDECVLRTSGPVGPVRQPADPKLGFVCSAKLSKSTAALVRRTSEQGSSTANLGASEVNQNSNLKPTSSLAKKEAKQVKARLPNLIFISSIL